MGWIERQSKMKCRILKFLYFIFFFLIFILFFSFRFLNFYVDVYFCLTKIDSRNLLWSVSYSRTHFSLENATHSTQSPLKWKKKKYRRNIGNACWSLKTVNYPTMKSFSLGVFVCEKKKNFSRFFIEFVIARACQSAFKH
jgi:hypothetical protein